MDNLMEASVAVDHARHTRDFTDRLKKIATPAHLEAVCKRYQAEKGFFAQRTFVAIFRRPGSAAIVWRQRFTRAEGDFVAEMLLVETDSGCLVDHVMVF